MVLFANFYIPNLVKVGVYDFYRSYALVWDFCGIQLCADRLYIDIICKHTIENTQILFLVKTFHFPYTLNKYWYMYECCLVKIVPLA